MYRFMLKWIIDQRQDTGLNFLRLNRSEVKKTSTAVGLGCTQNAPFLPCPREPRIYATLNPSVRQCGTSMVSPDANTFNVIECCPVSFQCCSCFGMNLYSARAVLQRLAGVRKGGCVLVCVHARLPACAEVCVDRTTRQMSPCCHLDLIPFYWFVI